jgi:hypothetical protein
MINSVSAFIALMLFLANPFVSCVKQNDIHSEFESMALNSGKPIVYQAGLQFNTKFLMNNKRVTEGKMPLKQSIENSDTAQNSGDYLFNTIFLAGAILSAGLLTLLQTKRMRSGKN